MVSAYVLYVAASLWRGLRLLGGTMDGLCSGRGLFYTGALYLFAVLNITWTRRHLFTLLLIFA